MRHYRCYHPDIINPQHDLILTPAASHHLSVVLRAKTGNPIEVFDVKGMAYQGELLITGKKVSVRLIQPLTKTVESPLYLHLIQAMAKNDKIDWVIQKAVELGVSEISLVLTERSEVRIPPDQWQKKMAHYQGVLISAVEQSGRVKVPMLNAPVAFNDCMVAPIDADIKLIMHPRNGNRLRDLSLRLFSSACILIGPEGGFSEAELSLAQENAYQAILLGPRVMRTETAPLAILSALQLLQGDFG